MATRKKAPAKGARRPVKTPATRSGSQQRRAEQTVITSPPGYTVDLDARAAAVGMTRSAYVRAAVEAYGGPEGGTITVAVDAAMLAALREGCSPGVLPAAKAYFVLKEALGLWGSPVGEKAAAGVADEGANCRHCGHYETSRVRAEAHYAHCPSCNLHTRWVAASSKAAE